MPANFKYKKSASKEEESRYLRLYHKLKLRQISTVEAARAMGLSWVLLKKLLKSRRSPSESHNAEGDGNGRCRETKCGAKCVKQRYHLMSVADLEYEMTLEAFPTTSIKNDDFFSMENTVHDQPLEDFKLLVSEDMEKETDSIVDSQLTEEDEEALLNDSGTNVIEKEFRVLEQLLDSNGIKNKSNSQVVTKSKETLKNDDIPKDNALTTKDIGENNDSVQNDAPSTNDNTVTEKSSKNPSTIIASDNVTESENCTNENVMETDGTDKEETKVTENHLVKTEETNPKEIPNDDCNAESKKSASEKEDENTDLLKNQIMDTEDLLTIVDKSSENGKDEASSDQSEKDNDDDLESDDLKLHTEIDAEAENELESLENVDGEIDLEYSSLVLETEDQYEDKSTDVNDESNPDISDSRDENKVLKTETCKDGDTLSNEKDVGDVNTSEKLTGKRSSSSPDLESKPKRTKLDSESNNSKVVKLDVLSCLSEFMNKRSLKNISRKQLEQLCLQKICEAIGYKSEIGELRHQLQQQEQLIETWRKESQVLSKQTRDLDIVNRRLLVELKQRFDREKPLLPVKITRSVGLQVKLESVASIIPRKRTIQKTIPLVTTFHPTTTTTTQIIKSPVIPTTKKHVKVGNVKSRAVSNASSNAITTTAAAKAVLTTVATPAKVLVGNSFIDLTDEDDRKGVRAGKAKGISSQTKGTTAVVSPSTNATTSGAPRIMYFYNNQLHQGVIAQPSQKLMLTVNSNVIGTVNGITTSVMNGSTQVKTTSPIQSARIAIPTSLTTSTVAAGKSLLKHPAPLPPPPASQLTISSRKPIPPQPHLSIRRSSSGIVLSWKMPYNLDNFESIASYQLYAYQETSSPPSMDMWRKVGDVKALALPMACTLTQFADGNKYYFAVRAVDVHKRMGPFSAAEQILL